MNVRQCLMRANRNSYFCGYCFHGCQCLCHGCLIPEPDSDDYDHGEFKDEVQELSRALQCPRAQSSTMDLGALPKAFPVGALPVKSSDCKKSKPDDGKVTDKKCNYCHKSGHMWKECRNRIADEAATGDYKGKKGKAAGANPRTLAKDACTYCGRTGHKEANCFTKRRDRKPGEP